MSNMMSRLTMLHINLIGVGTALVLSLILFFAIIKPKKDETQNVQAETASLQSSGGTLESVDGKKKDLAKTKADAVTTEKNWQLSSARYMPELGLKGPDLLPTYENRLIYIPAKWGTFVTRWYNIERRYGVNLFPGIVFAVPPFPADPNTISTIDHLTFPADGRAWGISLEAKNFDAAMDHLRRINSMTGYGMPVINNVALAGQSPHLIMTYDLAMYVIPKVPPPAADPRISGGGGAGGPGGAGGMGRGAMGGPMGGFGGPGGGPGGKRLPQAAGGVPSGGAPKGGSGTAGAGVE